jgi:hypothetical protein
MKDSRLAELARIALALTEAKGKSVDARRSHQGLKLCPSLTSS